MLTVIFIFIHVVVIICDILLVFMKTACQIAIRVLMNVDIIAVAEIMRNGWMKLHRWFQWSLWWGQYTIYRFKSHSPVSSSQWHALLLDDVLDEEALKLRRVFRRERVFWDGSDHLAFAHEHLTERYRFSGDGIRYLCRLLGPKIQHQTAWSHALPVPQTVCVTLPGKWHLPFFCWRCREPQQRNYLPHNKTC